MGLLDFASKSAENGAGAPVPAITLGVGLTRPQGRRLVLDGPSSPGRLLAEALAALPPGENEQWWSPGLFTGDYRDGDRWTGSWFIGVDADYQDAAGKHAVVPLEVAARIELAVAAGDLPGNLYHPTPRGLRVIFALEHEEHDAAAWEAAARGACALVERWLAASSLLAVGVPAANGYEIDTAASCDKARLLYTPRSLVNGVQR